jgi:hypothetical protein
MADLGMMQRREFMWLLALLGLLAVVGVLWLLSSMMEGRAADLELDMDAGGAGTEVSWMDRGGMGDAPWARTAGPSSRGAASALPA